MQKNCILVELCANEQRMVVMTMDKNQSDSAEGHYQRSLAYSKKLIEEEGKTDHMS
jgi:hypothetical protein